MNTILITGTAQTNPFKISKTSTGFKVEYDIIIWGNTNGEDLQFITSSTQLLCGFPDLWSYAKNTVAEYFKNSQFFDGAYTQFLDHLIIK